MSKYVNANVVNWDNILGVKEVAQFTRLSENTIRQYKSAGKLPKPDAIKSGNPLWSERTIRVWIIRNNDK